MRVLVTDGSERASLAVTRSLGSKGIEVIVGESYSPCTAALSKFCSGFKKYAPPDGYRARFIDSLLNILSRNKYDVIYPIREVTTQLISHYRSELEKYTIVPLPAKEKIALAHDKGETIKLATSLHIPCPASYMPENLEQLREIANRVTYPVVVKPRSKTVWKSERPLTFKVTANNYVGDKETLLSRFEEIFQKSSIPPLVQERIEGDGVGVECLCHHGEIRALFMHRRLREYPVTGGASTLRESFYDETLKELASRLLKEIKWHGVAMVEFKIDRRDNTPKLMEINGRFWGSLALSVASGVDFPYLLHKLMTEGDVSPVLRYREGVKCRWLVPGDILWFFSSMKHNNQRFKTMREFFRFTGVNYDVESMRDFMPIFGEMWAMCRQFNEVLTGRRNISGEIIG